MYLNENFKYIIEYLNRTRKNILNYINEWLSSKKDFQAMQISPRELNNAFNALIKPSNPYCKANFIDFNFVVDQILQMSLPYNNTESKNKQGEVKDTELSKQSFETFDAKNKFKNSNFINPKNFSYSQNSHNDLYLVAKKAELENSQLMVKSDPSYLLNHSELKDAYNSQMNVNQIHGKTESKEID